MDKLNELGPHKTVIWVIAMTYELLPTGECSGKAVATEKLIGDVMGTNKEECLIKTQEKLEEVKKCLKQ